MHAKYSLRKVAAYIFLIMAVLAFTNMVKDFKLHPAPIFSPEMEGGLLAVGAFIVMAIVFFRLEREHRNKK